MQLGVPLLFYLFSVTIILVLLILTGFAVINKKVLSFENEYGNQENGEKKKEKRNKNNLRNKTRRKILMAAFLKLHTP